MTTREKRRVLGVTCGVHALHDGYTDLLYILLPLWQAHFGLSYGLVGALRGLYTGTMALFQVPASLLSVRIGNRTVLVLGTVMVAAGYLVAGFSGGLVGLCVGLTLGGLGASSQHPIASSLVAGVYDGPESRGAISTYNFAGDVGKMIVPLLGSFLLSIWTQRAALVCISALGLAVALGLRILLPEEGAQSAPAPREGPCSTEKGDWNGFSPLVLVGIIDSATRMGFLTFLPFVLRARGAPLPTVGLAFSLLFAGGALGKLVCGFLGTRIGVLRTVWLTEGLTAAAILAIGHLPLTVTMAMLPVLGTALNGTSSVLYGAVPELAPKSERGKAFGIFYTATIGGGALAPIAYGMLGDHIGLSPTVAVIACVVLLTLPLSVLTNRHLRQGL